MRNLSRYITTVAGSALLAIALTFLPACKATLEPGGAYAPVVTNQDGTVTATARANIEFFAIDSGFDLAVATIDTAFLFERDNRVFLWSLSPAIKQSLDKLRPQAVEVKRRYALARGEYLRNPTPAGLSWLETVLSEAKGLAASAAAALPSKG